MTKFIEELLDSNIFLKAAFFPTCERVIYELDCLPVTLSFKDIVHNYLGATIAVGHAPSVEMSQPNFFEEDLLITWTVILNLFCYVIDLNFSTAKSIFVILIRSKALHDWVDERSEILTGVLID